MPRNPCPDQIGLRVRIKSESLSGSPRNAHFFIPFGYHPKNEEHFGPGAGAFVGREGERAYLINELTQGGRRGSFLVTGRRGSGKTSFVDHCLDEYQAGLFSKRCAGTVGV